MKYGCPNNTCRFYKKKNFIVKDGSYFRQNDSRIITRYQCKNCGKRFSNSTYSLAYRQKKRRVNYKLFHLLVSGISMRRAAKILNIHKTTVKRKLIYLAKKAKVEHEVFLKMLQQKKVKSMQFDDLITIEHTKLKPLSVTIAIDASRRFVLGTEVSQIPAFGHLAKISRKKYGYRKSFHNAALDNLFKKIKDVISPHAKIDSDEHTNYPKFVKKYFPKATHNRHKGGRGCVAGQGELKKLYYDPLFNLNHTCAMFRANINRLIRKTWCTSKDPKMLENHLMIFTHYYNSYYLK